MQNLIVGLEGWVIQDGNYPDLTTNEVFDFAIEYHSLKEHQKIFVPLNGNHKEMDSRLSISHVKENTYKVMAKIVFCNERATVLDFGNGLMAYREFHNAPSAPAKPVCYTYIDATIGLSVDPFFYKAYLHKIKDIPQIIHKWHINKIEMDMTPLIKVKGSPKYWTRDESKIEHRVIQKTNAWEDDAMSPFPMSSYLLHVSQK